MSYFSKVSSWFTRSLLLQFNRQNAFLQHKIAPFYLPQALLQLFVDIEFTGHAMQFEQKFGKSNKFAT